MEKMSISQQVMNAGVPVCKSRKLAVLDGFRVPADEKAENSAFWMSVTAMTHLKTRSLVMAPCGLRVGLKRW